MKSLLLITCLIASLSCFSQVFPAKYQEKERQFLSVKNDTVELTGNIRFIKVDGKVYEIKRITSVSIEEATPQFRSLFTPGSGIQYYTVPAIGRLTSITGTTSD